MRKFFIVLNIVALATLFYGAFFLYRQNKQLEECNVKLGEKINALMGNATTANLKDRLGELAQSVDSQLSRLNKLQGGVAEIQSDIPDIKSGLNNALARIKAVDKSSDISDLEKKIDGLESKYRDADLRLDKVELWEYKINKLSDWDELKGSVENIGKYVFGAYPCDGFRYASGSWNKSLKDQMDELINTIRFKTRY